MRRSIRFLLTGSAFLCTSTFALAQQDTSPLPTDDETSDTIVVTGYGRTDQPTAATGLPLSPLETPQTISVITQQQMKDQAFNTINDALDFTVGISKKDVDRGRSAITARGFEVQNFQLDGAPFANGNVGFGETSTAQYERVDLVRGAAGLMQGAGDPSAVVNLIRKHATEQEFAGNISLEAGSWDRFAATLDIQSPLNAAGTVRARAVAQAYTQDSFVDLEKKKGLLLYGVIDADLGDRTTLSIGASYQRDERDGIMWAQLPYWYSDGTRTDWPRSKTTGTDWGLWNTTEISAFATLKHKLSGDWEIRGDIAYHKGIENSKLLWLDGLPDRITGAGVGTSGYWYKTSPEQWHTSIQANGSFALLGGQHDLAFGAMASRVDDGWTNRDPIAIDPIDDFNSFDGRLAEPEWGERYDMSGFGNTTQAAVYASTRISLIGGLKLIGGGRLSYYKRNEHESKFGSPYSLSYKGQITPYVGLVYNVTDNLSAYASYTNIFKPQGNLRDRNNRLIDPLEGSNYEAGLKALLLDGQLLATVSVYRIEQDNLAVADGLIPGTPLTAYRGMKGTVAKGYELEIVGKITPQWDVSAGWSDYSAKDADGAQVLAHQPRRAFNFATRYDFTGTLDGLSVGGAVKWESRPPVTAVNPGTNVEERIGQPAYAIANIMARYDLTEALSLQANVDNLFDKRFFSGNVWFPGFVYGEPRNARVTLRYAF
ncbi:TonB-dependent siderophore receptor [Sphingopyxis sp. C-1]|uniref:TonB-dependent siderophore receptor n=1 Tax=Sphingopyxis sp. C-1 TaxID=262667 RepID=UPI0006C1E1F1|nr:TonB-dependent siderophore receptor [Sphingopyxis sp. C-1]GAO79367.1 putative OMR family iron-siderophore receptor precursor [Sphingopyxis sp. C-1]